MLNVTNCNVCSRWTSFPWKVPWWQALTCDGIQKTGTSSPTTTTNLLTAVTTQYNYSYYYIKNQWLKKLGNKPHRRCTVSRWENPVISSRPEIKAVQQQRVDIITIQNCPSCGNLGLHLISMVPWAHTILHPKWHHRLLAVLCTALPGAQHTYTYTHYIVTSVATGHIHALHQVMRSKVELERSTKKLDHTDSVIDVTWTGRFSTWSSSGKWQWNVHGFLQLVVVISW